MNDLIVLAMTLAFFAATVAYIGVCDRIIGPDPEPDAERAADRADNDVDVIEPSAVTA